MDQDGNVLREDKRVLRDPAHLHDVSLPAASAAPLHYDKALLRRWLGRGPDKLWKKGAG